MKLPVLAGAALSGGVLFSAEGKSRAYLDKTTLINERLSGKT